MKPQMINLDNMSVHELIILGIRCMLAVESRYGAKVIELYEEKDKDA
jgi:hypothetical protein